jgi:hypothetical protein
MMHAKDNSKNIIWHHSILAGVIDLVRTNKVYQLLLKYHEGRIWNIGNLKKSKKSKHPGCYANISRGGNLPDRLLQKIKQVLQKEQKVLPKKSPQMPP